MERNKHDHKATKKLKAWLFGIMLLLPFLFMLPTGLYYGLNQNAQLSERTEQQPIYYESNEVNSFDDLINGNIYTWNDNYTLTTSNNTITLLTLENIEQLITEYGFIYDVDGICTIVVNNYASFLVYTYTNYNQFYNINSTYFQFVLKAVNNTTFDTSLYTHIIKTDRQLVKEYLPITYTNDISTSIINAWNSTWQNPLFSWTNNTFITTTINNFTSGFGITADTYISNLITYIAILTAVYVIFDIIIELFTKLTHIVPRSD